MLTLNSATSSAYKTEIFKFICILRLSFCFNLVYISWTLFLFVNEQNSSSKFRNELLWTATSQSGKYILIMSVDFWRHVSGLVTFGVAFRISHTTNHDLPIGKTVGGVWGSKLGLLVHNFRFHNLEVNIGLYCIYNYTSMAGTSSLHAKRQIWPSKHTM